MQTIAAVGEFVAAQGEALRIPQHRVSAIDRLVFFDQHVIAIPDADEVAAPGDVEVFAGDGISSQGCARAGVDVDAE